MIAQEIVDETRADGARFLKKANARDMKRLGIPKTVEGWCIVHGETVLEKVKQALRQKAECHTTAPQEQVLHSPRTVSVSPNEMYPSQVSISPNEMDLPLSNSEMMSLIDSSGDAHIFDDVDWETTRDTQEDAVQPEQQVHHHPWEQPQMSQWAETFAAAPRMPELNDVLRTVSTYSDDDDDESACAEEDFGGLRFYPYFFPGYGNTL